MLFLVCFVTFFSDVCVWCDKCNDFVFHYLLDYSCRFFVFSLVLVDSALLSAHSQKTVDFNQCVGVENSFALVPCFRAEIATLRSRLVLLISVLQAVRGDFSFFQFVLLFTAILCFASGSRRLPSVSHFPRGQSAFPCFYLL